MILPTKPAMIIVRPKLMPICAAPQPNARPRWAGYQVLQPAMMAEAKPKPR